jgi:hypothetical protein
MKPDAADAPKPADGEGPSAGGRAVGGEADDTPKDDTPKDDKPKDDKAADDSDKPKKLPDSPLRSFAWAMLSANEFLFID